MCLGGIATRDFYLDLIHDSTVGTEDWTDLEFCIHEPDMRANMCTSDNGDERISLTHVIERQREGGKKGRREVEAKHHQFGWRLRGSPMPLFPFRFSSTRVDLIPLLARRYRVKQLKPSPRVDHAIDRDKYRRFVKIKSFPRAIQRNLRFAKFFLLPLDYL